MRAGCRVAGDSRYVSGCRTARPVTTGPVMYDTTPQGASHMAPIMAQPSNAMPTGPETTQSVSMSVIRSGRMRLRIPRHHSMGGPDHLTLDEPTRLVVSVGDPALHFLRPASRAY